MNDSRKNEVDILADSSVMSSWDLSLNVVGMKPTICHMKLKLQSPAHYSVQWCRHIH